MLLYTLAFATTTQQLPLPLPVAAKVGDVTTNSGGKSDRRSLLLSSSAERVTTATAPVKTPAVPCAQYCFDRGYPPNSGQQIGIPPACGSTSCAQDCPNALCVDNYDPACWIRPAICCCGTGFAPCSGSDAQGKQMYCPSDATTDLWNCVNGGDDGTGANPPYYTCDNPDDHDSSHGMYRDGTCTEDPGSQCAPAPAPSHHFCIIQSQVQCDDACGLHYRAHQPSDDNQNWVAFWISGNCECYLAQQSLAATDSYKKIDLASYACTTTTTTIKPTTAQHLTTAQHTTGMYLFRVDVPCMWRCGVVWFRDVGCGVVK